MPGAGKVEDFTTPSARVKVRVLIICLGEGLVVGDLGVESRYPADHRDAAVDDLNRTGLLEGDHGVVEHGHVVAEGQPSATEPSAGSMAAEKATGCGGRLGGLLLPGGVGSLEALGEVIRGERDGLVVDGGAERHLLRACARPWRRRGR